MKKSALIFCLYSFALYAPHVVQESGLVRTEQEVLAETDRFIHTVAAKFVRHQLREIKPSNRGKLQALRDRMQDRLNQQERDKKKEV